MRVICYNRLRKFFIAVYAESPCLEQGRHDTISAWTPCCISNPRQPLPRVESLTECARPRTNTDGLCSASTSTTLIRFATRYRSGIPWGASSKSPQTTSPCRKETVHSRQRFFWTAIPACPGKGSPPSRNALERFVHSQRNTCSALTLPLTHTSDGPNGNSGTGCAETPSVKL